MCPASERHEMQLGEIRSSGDEEWDCPICGRRMLVKWKPEFEKAVLEAGDDYALHSITRGLLPTPPLRATSDEEDQRLTPWLTWMEEVDFEGLWKDDS